MAHLLLVEDNHHLQVLYRIELNEAGHSIRIASTLAQALREIRVHPPALVLLDLHLPDADGSATLAEVVDATPRQVPIVVNTAYDRYRNLIPKGRKITYIVKSSDLTDLRQAVTMLLTEAPRVGRPRGRSKHSAASAQPSA